MAVRTPNRTPGRTVPSTRYPQVSVRGVWLMQHLVEEIRFGVGRFTVCVCGWETRDAASDADMSDRFTSHVLDAKTASGQRRFASSKPLPGGSDYWRRTPVAGRAVAPVPDPGPSGPRWGSVGHTEASEEVAETGRGDVRPDPYAGPAETSTLSQADLFDGALDTLGDRSAPLRTR